MLAMQRSISIVMALLAVLWSAPGQAATESGVCSYINRIKNNSSLQRRAERSIVDSSVPVPESLNGTEIHFKSILDIDSDGQPEYVYVGWSPHIRGVEIGANGEVTHTPVIEGG